MARRFDAALKDDPDVARWSTYVGRGAIRFYLPLDVQLPNDFFAQAVIVAKDVAARERLQDQAGEDPGRRFPERRRPRLTAGARAAGRMAGAVSGQRPRPGEGPRNRAQARPDRRRPTRTRCMSTSTGSSRRGRCASASTRTKRACWASARRRWRACSTPSYPAHPITQVRDDIYLVDVVARATDEQRVSLDTLRDLQVPLPNGRTVPLSQFATFEYEQDYPLIWRRDRVPTLTVQADVTPGRAAGDGRRGAARRGRRLWPKTCRGPTASPSAARWRRARSRRPRSSPSCRRCCSSCSRC